MNVKESIRDFDATKVEAEPFLGFAGFAKRFKASSLPTHPAHQPIPVLGELHIENPALMILTNLSPRVTRAFVDVSTLSGADPFECEERSSFVAHF